MSEGIDWPEEYPRTERVDREPAPFSTSLTRKEAFESIVEELQRRGATTVEISTASQHYADRPNIPHQHDKPDDVGVVARFRLEGEHTDRGYAIACDRWESQLENARAISLYVRRKRLAEKCGVTTASAEFSTAALPPGDGEAVGAVAVEPVDDREPHEILGIAPDAPDDVIRGAARARIKSLRPDSAADGEADPEELKKVREAKQELLGGAESTA